ncbi:MAG TPA: hypothetical protein ENK85_04110 [Saprospiraceae bacterium]|nr:hypothetical protein [Saprospiraceae bacterium]
MKKDVKISSENSLLQDLFQAYYDARQNKRNTINALNFEMNYESNLLTLYQDIIERKYTIRPSICFINFSPVQREIFAADFRDRVVHHLIYNYISPVFEKEFINDSYSCRKGKGTHYGIKRITKFIRSCSRNCMKDCYILKLDIKGYFMAMNKHLLYDKVKKVLENRKDKLTFDYDMLNYLLKKVIFNDPTKYCVIKGKKSDWKGLPKTKSLFHADKDCGLPIGNLTSQLFGNVYMNKFDHFVKRDLGIKYYGRYVDDFILIHPDKNYLKWMIELIKSYLLEKLQLELHPDKIYLQHYSKGVKYLGAVIKPHRTYIATRTKGNFYTAIQKQNAIANDHKPTKSEQQEFIASMNSYLGIMKQYKTHRMRKKMIFKNLSAWWWNYVYLTGGISKFVLKRK